MAKKKEEVIKPRCDYCVHNKGENQQFKFMYECENLGYCVPFGYNFCKAEKLSKGKFKIDREKYKEYINVRNGRIIWICEKRDESSVLQCRI